MKKNQKRKMKNNGKRKIKKNHRFNMILITQSFKGLSTAQISLHLIKLSIMMNVLKK